MLLILEPARHPEDDQKLVAARVYVEVNAPFQHRVGEWLAKSLGWVQQEESRLVLAVMEHQLVAVTNVDCGQIAGVDESYRWTMLVDAWIPLKVARL